MSEASFAAPFTVLPALELRQGKVVQLVDGDPGQVALERPDPGQQAQEFADAGAAWVHVVDLDAALGGRNQWQHLGRIQRAGLRIQFGGGIRSMTQVQQLLDLGVERVVVGTQGVTQPAWTRELATVFPGRVVVALDARDSDLQVEGWRQSSGLEPLAVAAGLDPAGLAGFIYTSLKRKGTMGGPDRAAFQALRLAAPRTPTWVAGGVATLEDLAWLKEAGAAGAIVGMGVYRERLDLAAAFEQFPSPSGPVLQVLRAREEAWAEDDAT